jgi:hypothetical protein
MTGIAILLAAALQAAPPAADPKVPAPDPIPLADISRPDSVIGAGSPDTVSEKALRAALRKGGVIVFNTGGQPVTIKLSEPLVLPQNARPTVLDGLGLVTLDGDGKTRILQKEWKTELTVQRLKFQHARTEKEGAAIWNVNWDGRLTVLDCAFEDCKTTQTGPDIGGGAIRVNGQRHLYVARCSFTDCEGSNGGAICIIGCQLSIVDCSFLRCRAYGYGGGADRGPTGQGGIGGAVYVDGVSQNGERKLLYVANSLFKDSRAGDHAGAFFGYTLPNQASTSVYLNCIFENSVVDEPKERGLGMAGAVYSQYCHLHVLNCTFAHNKAPRMAGSLFTAQMESERVENCEFYGNTPESGSRKGQSGRRDVPPAVTALGRLPGPPPPKEKKPPARIAPPPAAPAAAKPVDPAMKASFLDRLRGRVREEIAAERPPIFTSAVASQPAKVVTLDDQGKMKIRMEFGGGFDGAWDQLTPPELADLAVSVLRKGNAEDHAQAAFFLLLSKQSVKAGKHLDLAGEPGKAVRAAFAAE